TEEAASWPGVGTYAVGGLVGGVVGGLLVVAVVCALKWMLEIVSAQDTWVLIVMPVIGLALASLLLNGFGRRAPATADDGRPRSSWRSWAPGAIPADITGDVQSGAGREERRPWRLAPLRLAAIFATVGSGAAMGTEAPAAYLASAAG